MKRATLHLLAIALTAVLAACASQRGIVMTRSYIAPTYGPTILNSAGKYDGVKLEVVGNPFAAPDEAVHAATAEAIRTTGFASRLPLTTGEADPRSPFRLVALFSPAIDINFDDICYGSRKQAATPPEKTELMLTYCFGEGALTSLRARRGGIAGPDDPRFESFVRNATAALFPPRDETAGDGRDDDFFD